MNADVEGWINGLAGHSGLADKLMELAAKDLIFLAVPLVLALWFWPAGPTRRALNQRLAVAATLGAIIAIAFNAGASQLHSDVRPFVSDPSTKLLISHSADNGFPSDHTAFAFGVAGALVWWRRLLGLVAVLGAALVAFARVYVGVHWPTDVLAGAAIGLVAGAVAAWFVPWFVIPQRWAARLLPEILVARP